VCLLLRFAKMSVLTIGIGGWLHLKSCWVSYTCDKELFCCRLVTGVKTWFYHWAPVRKVEFMQWKDVDHPTFTRICKSAINWLDYGKFFWDTDGLLVTDCLHPGRQLLVSNERCFCLWTCGYRSELMQYRDRATAQTWWMLMTLRRTDERPL